MRLCSLLFLALLLVPCPGAHALASDDTLIDYLERYHRLPKDDASARLELADWCADRKMIQQQSDLLMEVLAIRPDHATAHKDLLELDAKRSRPVDPAWEAKLKALLGGEFRLHHSAHFTVVGDTAEEAMRQLAEAMEQTYRLFYAETTAIGLRPLPPQGRLVCVLFERHQDYLNYLRKLEGTDVTWTSGYYSWRTNRVAFFHDRDSPGLKEARDFVGEIERQITSLREELDEAGTTLRRIQIQEQLKKLTAAQKDLSARVAFAAEVATLGKTRHEAAHQLFFNSGLQRRGRSYPFWLNEGMATCFEPATAEGNSGPRTTNPFRLNIYRAMQASESLLPLTELLTADPGAKDPTEIGRLYTQVWALAHFLWVRHPRALRGYMQDLDAGATPKDWGTLFTKHFGDAARLEPEFRRFMDAL